MEQSTRLSAMTAACVFAHICVEIGGDCADAPELRRPPSPAIRRLYVISADGHVPGRLFRDMASAGWGVGCHGGNEPVAMSSNLLARQVGAMRARVAGAVALTSEARPSERMPSGVAALRPVRQTPVIESEKRNSTHPAHIFGAKDLHLAKVHCGAGANSVLNPAALGPNHEQRHEPAQRGSPDSKFPLRR